MSATKITPRLGAVDPDFAVRIMDRLEDSRRIVDGQEGLRADFVRRQIAFAETIMLCADAAIRTGIPEFAAQLHAMVGDAWQVKP